jgi:hypothetical protein
VEPGMRAALREAILGGAKKLLSSHSRLHEASHNSIIKNNHVSF